MVTFLFCIFRNFLVHKLFVELNRNLKQFWYFEIILSTYSSSFRISGGKSLLSEGRYLEHLGTDRDDNGMIQNKSSH